MRRKVQFCLGKWWFHREQFGIFSHGSWGFLAVKWKDNRKITERCLDLSRHSDEFQQHVVICCNSVTYFDIFAQISIQTCCLKSPKQGLGSNSDRYCPTGHDLTIRWWLHGYTVYSEIYSRLCRTWFRDCHGSWHLTQLPFVSTTLLWSMARKLYIKHGWLDGSLVRWLDTKRLDG